MVARMVRAWNEAPESFDDLPLCNPVDEAMILDLATIIHPDNRHGYRVVPVTIQGIFLGWENIRRQMEMLLAAQDNLSPEEFYKEFEEIHPFEDGNGRVGAILYNFLRGSMDDPEFPPNFWKSY